MPVYETGHARNIQRFQEMISFVTSWGAPYAPSNTAISLASLNTKATDATTALANVTGSLTTFKTAVNDRENAFSGLRKLTTRIVNYYKSTGAAQNNIDNLLSVKRKIDGTRAKVVTDDPSTPENEAENSISASQQSYTQLIEHFSSLIELVTADPLYAPAETDLTTIALNTLKGQLITANQAVIDNTTALSNDRAARDAALYASAAGLVDLAGLVKAYTKAAFGTGSSQYTQIKGLKFTRPRG